MKIKIRNLGVIKTATVDIKPLTVFVGPNNQGKTWLAYTLAGIFGSFGYKEYMDVDTDAVLASYPLLHNSVEHFLKNGNTSVDLIQFAREYGKLYFTNVAQQSKVWLPQFMSTRRSSFENLDISIESLEEKEAHFFTDILNANLEVHVPNREAPIFSIRKNHKDSKLYVYTSTEALSSNELVDMENDEKDIPPLDILKDLLVRWVFQIVHRAIFREVYTLPTERTTIITVPFGQQRQSKSELVIDKVSSSTHEQKLNTMIEPVNSFLRMIAPTFLDYKRASDRRERDKKNEPKIKDYIQLARILEKQILGGELSFPQTALDVTEDVIQAEFDPREILFKPNKKIGLDISISSSMVKELSTLALYLRYIAKPDQLLVIDEPEMNLHPEAQVKMIEFIAMLVNAGLNVLITTHSPYMLDHLTNLIKAEKVENKESIQDEFYLKKKEAFIAQKDVSIYLFNEGKVINAVEEDGIIQLNTFGDVSDRVSEIYFQL